MTGDGLSTAERTRWRHELRASAGKLAAAWRGADVAGQAWAELVADARAAGIPAVMVVAAMADAGLPTDGAAGAHA